MCFNGFLYIIYQNFTCMKKKLFKHIGHNITRSVILIFSDLDCHNKHSEIGTVAQVKLGQEIWVSPNRKLAGHISVASDRSLQLR